MNKNKFIKKAISGIMVVMLGAYTLPIYAFSNEEVVYSKIDTQGKNYKTIVTTKEKDEIKQDNSNKELPLETKITYTLDGKEISAKDLAGKSGKVSIKIEYINKSSKQEYINGKYETMYTPFVVAVGSIINSEKNKNIQVTNGKVIETGDKAIVVGIVMPGLEESLKLTGELADINIPSSIEITMDATEFEMKNIVSYASPRIFNKDVDWSKLDNLFDKANQLKTSINQIEDGANTLRDGISTLGDGAIQLKDGASKLDNGAVQLNDGANALNNGVSDLQNGTTTLNNGAKQLSVGANQLAGGANSVNDGATALNNGISELQAGLQDAGKGITSLKEGTTGVAAGAEKVNTGANSLKDGLNTLSTKTQNLQAGMTTIAQSVSELNTGAQTIKTSVDGLYSQLSAYASKTSELEQLINANKAVLQTVPEGSDLATVLNKNIAALEEEKTLLQKTSKVGELVAGATKIANGLNALDENTKTLPDTTKALSDGVAQLAQGATDLSNGTASLNNGAKQLDGGATELAKGSSALNTGVTNLKTGASQLQAGTTSLAQGAKNLNSGVTNLSNGTASLESGVNELAKGSSALATGTGDLSIGAKQLSEGTISLVDGTNKLKDGSLQLADGIHKYNVEGISKITNFINGDLNNLKTRAQRLEQLSTDYNKFNSDKVRDEIKFITIIDSVKTSSKDEEKQEIITNFGKDNNEE